MKATLAQRKAKKVKHGKRFEEDFVKSIPDRCDITRLKDAGGWSNATNMRFTSSNPCDFIVWNGEEQRNKCKMYKFELKSVQGKSLPFTNIKEHQLESMWISAYKYVTALFVVNFRAANKTYQIGAIEMMAHIKNSDRKSLSLENARVIGTLIPQTLIRVRWRYDLSWI